ncbi:MAG: hypothetical protein LBJ31_03645 [Treponema sp.]|nr:hypothetical protein [Treponema sp.]
MRVSALSSGGPSAKTGAAQKAQKAQKAPKAPKAQKAQKAQKAPFTPPRTLARLIADLSLPKDSLSRRLISAARFFSLPLNKPLLHQFRTQALAHKSRRLREAAPLALAAAAAKNLKLTAKALEQYAGAIRGETPREDKPVQERQAGDHGGTNDASGSGQNSQGNDGKKQRRRQDGPVFKKRALAALQSDPLLDFINRVPCKDGRRWVVIPLCIEEGGRSFTIALRFLLPADGDSPPESCTVDIEVCGIREDPEKARRYLVSIGKRRGLIAVSPSRSSIAADLEAALAWPAHSVQVKEYEPFTDILTDLSSVDEVV